MNLSLALLIEIGARSHAPRHAQPAEFLNQTNEWGTLQIEKRAAFVTAAINGAAPGTTKHRPAQTSH